MHSLGSLHYASEVGLSPSVFGAGRADGCNHWERSAGNVRWMERGDGLGLCASRCLTGLEHSFTACSSPPRVPPRSASSRGYESIRTAVFAASRTSASAAGKACAWGLPHARSRNPSLALHIDPFAWCVCVCISWHVCPAAAIGSHSNPDASRLSRGHQGLKRRYGALRLP